jgi:hypothetical protein
MVSDRDLKNAPVTPERKVIGVKKMMVAADDPDRPLTNQLTASRVIL